MRLSGRSTARRLTPGAPVQNPSHPGRVLLQFEENPVFDAGESRFRCRSTALGAKGSRTRTPSHPGRVLLRFEKNPVFDAGESRFRCRSTALGAKGSRTRTPSHPGRVLLRFEKNPGFDVGEPRFGCRSTALGAKRVSSQSTFAPGAGAPTVREGPPVLMQENPGLDVGAPPSVRKGVEPEHLRTRGGCSYGSRGTPGFDAGESRFGCRSPALGAKRESSKNTFAPGAGAPTVR